VTGTLDGVEGESLTKIGDLLAAGPTLSVEFFPPKTPEGHEQLQRTLKELSAIDLSFVSVTYGAGGSTREITRDVVIAINDTSPFPAMPHLTCAGHARADIETLLDAYDAAGIRNVLALAGDPPADGSPAVGDFSYASELVELMRSRGDMSIGVAAFPEVHPRSADRADDRRRLAEKLAMADFAITQFFFDADDYLRMIDELDGLGNNTPVLPGIQPITNTTSIKRFAGINGVQFPEELAARIDGAATDDDRLKIVVEAAASLSQRLLDAGVPGLHLYCLNRPEATLGVVAALNL
jgi:methylenetetrahydrofolate reductase (NADPH)